MLPKISIKNLTVSYGDKVALKTINLDIAKNEILAVIGPANSGKTTLLRVLNRLIELDKEAKVTGSVFLDNENIFQIELTELRRRVGIVFALPVVLPRSIFANVVYGPRIHGIKKKEELLEIAVKSLKAAGLYDEVKDRLYEPATKLSGGQQQRLCIARALAANPEVILMDEPCSGLDPISTAKIEENIKELKKEYTIIFVTNNTKQAARIGDRIAFFLQGELIEEGSPEKIFTAPKDKRTEDYITGRFG